MATGENKAHPEDRARIEAAAKRALRAGLPLEQDRSAMIGLAYELQRVSHLEPTPGDVPLDAVVTEERIYRR